jgi:hypothetical protein
MGALGLLGGIVSAGIGGWQAKQASEIAQAEHKSNKALLGDVFNKQYYQDITKRTEIQDMMRLLQEGQDRQAKRDAAVSAITGATQESNLASQESRNKSFADSMAEVAKNASSLKDAYLSDYTNKLLAMTNPAVDILKNQSAQWSQASSNLFGTGAKLLGSGIDSLTEK